MKHFICWTVSILAVMLASTLELVSKVPDMVVVGIFAVAISYGIAAEFGLQIKNKLSKLGDWWDDTTNYERNIIYAKTFFGILISASLWAAYTLGEWVYSDGKVALTVTTTVKVPPEEPGVEYTMPYLMDEILWKGKIGHSRVKYVCFNNQVVYFQDDGNRYVTFAPTYWRKIYATCRNWPQIKRALQVPKL